MPYWAWLALGLALLAMEMFAIDAAFYLFFLGVSALTVGGIAALEAPVWVQWVSFGVISVVAMVLFREELYQKLRGGLPGFEDKSMGNTVVIEAELAPGATARVELRGTTWTVKNVDTETIPSGTQASIDAVNGLTVEVKNPS
ncbi:MAG: NfeD family protein [Pseudomonadota bacterium]